MNGGAAARYGGNSGATQSNMIGSALKSKAGITPHESVSVEDVVLGEERMVP